MGYIQLFTDKSKTTLKSKGLVAYPVHLTFQNFTCTSRRKIIMDDRTLLGYHPVTLFPVENNSGNDYYVTTSSSSGRTTRVSIVHQSLKLMLAFLQNAVETGFICTDASNISRTCFPRLTNYCCDISEAKDITAITAGVNTRFPCHRCLVPEEQLASLNSFPTRTYYETRQSRDLNCDMSRWSINQLPSFLEDNPPVPSISGLDLYKLFRFEALHNLHLGISKLLKMEGKGNVGKGEQKKTEETKDRFIE